MFGTRGSVKLGTILGIRIGASPSWFAVLGLMIYFLADSFSQTLERYSDTTTFATAVAGAFCFFASLVMHELGHALVARRYGIGIHGIDLWLFGGLAKLDRDSRSPKEEFWVAIAGPLVTLAVVGLSVGVAELAREGSSFYDAATLSDGQTTPLIAAAGWLALVNVMLLAFNLIPAFPLDGGRIARAAAWKITGDRNRGTRISGNLGIAFSYLLGAGGLAILFSSDPFNGVWLCLLAWFINQGARSAVVSSRFSERLGAVRVAEMMDREPISVPASATALQADDEYFARYRTLWLPVTDAAGRYIGALRAERTRGAVHAGQPALAVQELIEPDGADTLRIDRETTLEELLDSPALRTHGSVAVVDDDRHLVGVITADQVRRALSASLAGN